jgi:hypothetical protein
MRSIEQVVRSGGHGWPNIAARWKHSMNSAKNGRFAPAWHPA